ncbi:MAG TPA: hypothetical protein VFX52_06570 [Nocardioidaceae bacterium]|nr:hypothetical protein [Nocardioidaceae bacterium]
MRHRLPRNDDEDWSPELLGIDSGDLPGDLATNADDYLAASGFGLDSL